MKTRITLSHCAKAQALLYLLILGATPSARAEFALNFQPVSDQTPTGFLINCQRGASGNSLCERGSASTDPDQTPFYQEIVTDGTYSYYHNIIGDPDSGFAIEYFIRAGGCCWGDNADAPLNASGGTYNGGADATPFGSTTFVDPLASDSTLTGNATGNPERVIFRQIVRDAEMSLDVTKQTFSNKPKISQVIDNGAIHSTFEFDMSNSGYNDVDTAGVLVNHLLIYDANLPGGLLDIDVAAVSQNNNITGGKYIYIPNKKGTDGSNGTYEYAQDGFDAQGVDWSRYWDPSVNSP